MNLLTEGLNQAPVASLALRLAAGAFFSISGYHKCMSKPRRASLKSTFQDDGVYSPAIMFLIPCGELAGGIALLFGFLAMFAAAGLIIILLGACVFDGLKRIPAWKPIDMADYLDDVLYLPEVLYILVLGAIILIGPGPVSIDALIWK